MAVGDFIEVYEFDYLMEQALSQVPEGIDTEEGSIIYDALAPACMQLAEIYMNLMNVVNDSFPATAIGEYLDLKVSEQGLSRLPATQGTKLATFTDVDGLPVDVPLGSRFSTIGSNSYIYRVIEKVIDGKFVLECEELGASSNSYIGEILPVDNISGLGVSLITETYVAGRDLESDDSLRNRYFQAINEKPFGGNISDYYQNATTLEGVGDVQVYPVWDGGGTVGLTIVDSDYMPASTSTLELVKNHFDPESHEQEGIGLSPIGHKVSVGRPTQVTLNITANVTTSGDTNVDSSIRESLENYFREVRLGYGEMTQNYEYHTYVYIARILVALLQTPGVVNASNVQINGSSNEIHWQQSFTNNRIPILGSVTLS